MGKLIVRLAVWSGCILFSFESVGAVAIIADHHALSQTEDIPVSVIQTVNDTFNFYYVHTSHGSQIMTGLVMVHDEDATYDPPYFYERSDDLGHSGDTSWVAHARYYLDGHPTCNVAMFSWCGGVSDNTEEGINIYLSTMSQLEQDYPDVAFIYMTGHLDGTGPEGNLYARNNQIRQYCLTNDKILFDFADIESYDPDGGYYPDANDDCLWCSQWCVDNPPCPGCDGCAHSHCFNCYLKGKVFWWLMARMSGWVPAECCVGRTGNVDCDAGDLTDLADLTRLIDHLFISFIPLCCPSEANTDGDLQEDVDIGDLTRLIDYLFISFNETEMCTADALDPTGDIVAFTYCKDMLDQTVTATAASDQDCLEYEYDDHGVLSLIHVNAGLNCCPVIVADVEIGGGLITITELDSLYMGGCDCLCLFDIEYEIRNLIPGQYRIRVIEPYRFGDDAELDFTVDLTTSPSGSYCVERTHYPWRY